MAGTFVRRPPKEAMDWFRAKGIKPGFDYRDVWREEHATAFTVAKATKLDILSDIRAEVDRALAEGKTFRDFAKDLKPTLQKKGWWGEQEVTDPVTGKKRTAQLGSTRRLKIIYETNMRTARAAGQWERIQRTKDGLPYLLYQLGPSRKHRPEHVAWHGLLLPVDDDFWATHMPINGWGCKCNVRQVSRTEYRRLERDGVRAPEPEQVIDSETGLPTGHRVHSSVPVRTAAPTIRRREWINKRTGEVHQVPIGIDPGWDYNPGVTGRLNKALEITAQKLTTGGAEGVAVIKELTAETLETWAKSPKADFPIGVMAEKDAARIGGKTQLVRLSSDTFDKQRRHHPELSLKEYLYVQDALERGETVETKPLHLAFILDELDGYVSVVKATRDGGRLYLVSFRRLPAKAARRDHEIRRLKKMKK